MQTPLLLIVDIDGTVADGTHRLHYITDPHTHPGETHLTGGKPFVPDFKSFLSPELCAKDTVMPRAFEVLRKFHNKQDCQIVFLTGRSIDLYTTTYEWLRKHFRYSTLICRPVDDQRVATEYKKDAIIDILAKYKPIITMAFDDDPFMYKIYLKFGIIPFKAPECWLSLYVDPGVLPVETAWRK
jgi:hypothetical protein